MKINTNNLKISIITPSLNAENYIERAIKSVLAQNYLNFEHIIIDAESKDNTINILKKYPHLKWISEKDTGQSNAMNKGFKLSSGDIIVYLNHDDYFLPDAFTNIVEFFNKGEKFVVGNVLVQELNGKETIVKPKIKHKEILMHWIGREYIEDNVAISSFPNNPVQYFYIREIQENIPFNENNHFTMDIEFLMEASLKYEFCKIDKILGVYYRREDAKAIMASSDVVNYWTTKTFSYIDKYMKNWKVDDILRFKNDQAEGYLFNIIKNILNKIDNQENTIQNRENTIKGKESLIEKQKKIIKEKELLIEKQKEVIKKKEILIKQQEEIIKRKESLFSKILEAKRKVIVISLLLNPIQKYKKYKHLIKEINESKN